MKPHWPRGKRKYFYMRKFALLVIPILIFAAVVARAGVEQDYKKIEELVDRGSFDEAEAFLKKRLDADDKDVNAITILGDIYLKKGDKKKAFKYLQKAIGLNPLYSLPHLYLGKTYFALGEFEKAVEEFEDFRDIMRQLSLKEDEKDSYADTLHDISHTYLNIKRYEEVYNVLQEILSLLPQDQVAMYNMGIYYYIYERSRPRAYQSFSRAIKIAPATHTAQRARYAIEFMRNNPDSRIEPDFSFLDRE